MPATPGKLHDLKRLDPSARAAACAEWVQQTRGDVQQRFEAGAAPGQLLRRLADRCDELLQALFACAELSHQLPVSLVALGGYGRRELFPYSDLDLLLLHQLDDAALLDRLVELVVYPLWDAGLSVGHAVRTVDQALDLAREDLTARTALLDARMLAGDPGPFHALEAGGMRCFFGPQRVEQFVGALFEERAGRHRRFGETEYLLEPNVKQGKGGLRDLNTALWAAKARFGAAALPELLGHGAASARQLQALGEAQSFLRHLRLAMHLGAGRAQDLLTFELQERLAPRLFPQLDGEGIGLQLQVVEPAVERLMHTLYRHTRAVVRETDGVLERCRLVGQEQVSPGEPLTGQADEHFVTAGRRMASTEPGRFWEEPAEMVRALKLVSELDRPLDRRTQDAIAEAAAGLPGRQLAADERGAELFLQLLRSVERPAQTALEELHLLGVLGALIPEFEPCTGRIQHDLYHVYTVDLHSLYVVAQLKAWRRGERAEQHPTPVALMARLDQLDCLLLAALLHDVAKPLGRRHAERGARIAAGVAARLGLEGQKQQRVAFLVREHLLMAHLSQRRDLADPSVIEAFAGQVREVPRLRELYLLTAADTAMTAPGNLTEWKAMLLEELYIRTFLRLNHAEPRREQVQDQRDALTLVLGRNHGELGQRLVQRVPEQMLLGADVDELAHHLQAALQCAPHEGRDASLVARPRARQAWEVTICCPDSVGRLAAITGLLLVHRVEVLGAQVFTLHAGHDGGEPLVLDVFSVTLLDQGQPPWDALLADLRRAIAGELEVDALVRSRARPSAIMGRVLPRVPIQVAVDNAASERFTVVEVQAPDWIGVLYAITRALSRCGLVIHLSKVASEAGRVVDIFYVSQAEDGGKLVDEERVEVVRRNVSGAIAALAPPPPGARPGS